jgi:NADPH:quinone reductase-like Zn-dependent oxidoreductase
MGPAEVDLPATQTAIITQDSLQLGISNHVPIPKLLEPGLIIVKNVAVGLNPTDYKMPANFPSPGAINGCDFAGVVVQIGPSVTKPLKVGDRVCGVVHGSNPVCHQSGSFAEYVAATADFVFKMPQNMDFETAAAFGGAALGTVGLALYQSLGLSWPDSPATRNFFVLVYGGSTTCGTMAIQLLRL